ncbi:MAG TPA: trypsin-like peptidase domain-containing protein [Myxococcota bacterium]|jgi:serine protease Do|nr:trypsin-like peptidase domain-containing protein [Myxococcota bacterium]
MKRAFLAAGFVGAAIAAFAAGMFYAGAASGGDAARADRKDGPPAAAAAPTPALWTERKDGGLSSDDPVKMSSFAKLAKDVSPAVVFIETNVASSGFDPFHGGERHGVGSGFIIHPDGYILTNNHVVDDATAIKVRTFDDREYDAEKVGTDAGVDIALLKIKGAKPFPVVPLGDSDKLEVGEWVVAIGNPFAYSHTVTAGIVSAKGRTDVMPGAPGHPPISGYYSFIQTDAAISPGNSGGPLINIRGEVIGINTAINAAAEGIAFAVPINVVKRMLPDLKEKGSFARSWLGVSIETLSSADAEKLGLPGPHGVRLTDVYPDGPAAKAGLRADDVILTFEGETIRTVLDLRFLAAHHGVGKEATLTVWRSGKVSPIKVALAALPSHDGDEPRYGSKGGKGGGGGGGGRGESEGDDEDDEGALGIAVMSVPPDVAGVLGLTPGEGVLVRDVDPRSPAAGVIKPRDVILRVSDKPSGGAPLRSAAEFYKRVDAIPDGAEVVFVIQRGAKKVFATLKKK